MSAIGCIFINRSDRRAAVEVIRRGAEQISSGQPMIIFPEGTRSRGPQLGRFKHGSLKLPLRAGATIVPVSISGSYKMLEQTGKIRPAQVRVTIHPPLLASAFDKDQTAELSRQLTESIGSGVDSKD